MEAGGSKQSNESETKPIVGIDINNCNDETMIPDTIGSEKVDNTLEDFKKIYKDTYGKEYVLPDNAEIACSERRITDAQEFANHVVVEVTFSVIGLFFPPLKMAGLASKMVYPLCGALVSSLIFVPNAGKYYVYTVIERYTKTLNVEVANYHGYSVYEPQEFDCFRATQYWVVNGEVSFIQQYEGDSSYAYTYRNHP